jgi:uncharacterized protein (DUF1800 family)
MPENQHVQQPHVDAASVANRFGLGAMPGTLDSMHDPRGNLVQQVRKPSPNVEAFAGLTRSADYLARENQYVLDRRERRQERVAASVGNRNTGNAANADPAKGAVDGFRKEFGEQLLAEVNARWQVALNAPLGFDERVFRFWSNHFAVSVDKRQALLYAAPMEREVIRLHAFGRFEDLLLGIETHPAMLRYLDNQESIGPGSQIGQRGQQVLDRFAGQQRQPKRKLGLNENLAREILELHTLGVNGGYTQADVTELACAITGWSVRIPRDERRGGLFGSGSTPDSTTGFVFRDNAHEPGSRSIVGKRYYEDGIEQGRRALADLAVHPATAKHLSFKLARHFVADEPPPKLVKHLAVAWLDGGGDLSTWYLAMLQSDEAWTPDARKFRTPDDFLMASLRALGTEHLLDARGANGLLARLGQPSFMPRSPAGFADTADAWIGPDALLKRIQAAEELSSRATRSLVPAQVARDALGSRLGGATAQAIARADSPTQALSILLASPDFQWRI